MSDIYGRLFEMPWAFCDPENSCLRTSEGISRAGLTRYSRTLPVSGSMRNGECFDRPMSVPLISGHVCSSLLPTPTSSDSKDGTLNVEYRNSQRANAGQSIQRAIALLPTPTTSDSNGPGEHGTGGKDLRTTISLLPTPTKQMDFPSTTSTAPVAANYTPGDSLTDAVRIVTGQATGNERTGANTPQPSDDGNTSSDGKHPHQQTLTGD